MYLKNLFDLENENNLILKDYSGDGIYKGKPCKVLRGEIIQENGCCPRCNSREVSKNGTYKYIISLTKLNDRLVVIDTTTQRYTCRNCSLNFKPKVSFVDKGKRISKQIHKQIAIDITTTTSSKQIARQNNVSINTVQRELEKFKEYNIVNKEYLPKVLCVDEFRGVKYVNAKMNFLIVDGEKRKIKDILINRNKNTLISYFKDYKKDARNNVKYFVSDFYSTYLDVASNLFPNAKIIIDRFHIKRLLSVNLKNKRIEVMKTFKKYHFPYKVLKRYKKLLFKNFNEISIEYKAFKYNYNKFHSEYDVLNYILSIDEELEELYWVYQDFIEAFDKKDIEGLREVINRDYSMFSISVQTTFETYKKYEEYIINAIKYIYSNGIVEGINTKIKLLKRVGYGYRNFENFRLRLMILFNLVSFEEDVKRKEKRIKEYHRKVS